MIRSLATGLVYTNPQPHLRAIHAWHPCLVDLGDGQLLCTFDLGQAAESLDYGTYVARSLDGGETWTPPAPLLKENTGPRRSTHTIRVARLSDGTLLGMGARFYRDNPDVGLTNRETLGFVPMDLISISSTDGGQTWTSPTTVKTPLTGPAFEVCHAPKPLTDGRCLFPTQTWPDWQGAAPGEMRGVAFVSIDNGKTWPSYVTTFDGREKGLIHFEQSIVELGDGRLLAVAWAFDSHSQTTLPTPYALAQGHGDFAPAKSTGLDAQTAKLLALGGGLVLCVYRGHRRAGLWAQVVRIDGERWVNLDEKLLWEGQNYNAAEPSSTSDKLSSLKFGFPSLAQLSDGSIRVVFWCEEGGLHNIRWFRLAVEEPPIRSPHFGKLLGKSPRDAGAVSTSDA